MVTGDRVTSSRNEKTAAIGALLDDPQDLDEVLAVMAETDPLARDASDNLARIPAAARYTGPLRSAVMLPFVLVRTSRFSSGKYGVLYVADELATAVAERGHHDAQALVAAAAAPTTVIRIPIRVTFEETHLFDAREADAAIYDPNGYVAAQRYGAIARDAGYAGLTYRSVRRRGRICYGIFQPSIVSNARLTGKEVRLNWDGTRFTSWELVTIIPL
jgi:hypothetical protein